MHTKCFHQANGKFPQHSAEKKGRPWLTQWHCCTLGLTFTYRTLCEMRGFVPKNATSTAALCFLVWRSPNVVASSVRGHKCRITVRMIRISGFYKGIFIIYSFTKNALTFQHLKVHQFTGTASQKRTFGLNVHESNNSHRLTGHLITATVKQISEPLFRLFLLSQTKMHTESLTVSEEKSLPRKISLVIRRQGWL